MAASVDFHDFDAMALFPPKWEQTYQQLGKGRFRGRLTMAQTPFLQFGLLSWSPGILIQGAIPLGTVALGVQVSQIPLYCRGRPLAGNQLVILQHGEDIDLVAPHACKLLVLAVDQEHLQRHMLALWGNTLAEQGVKERLNLRDATSRHRLIQNWSVLLALGQRHPERWQNPRCQGFLEYELLETLLTTTQPPPARQLCSAARHRLARRARDYLLAHNDEPVRLSELCEWLGASERTLHLGFRECFGLSPKAYLKWLRLNQVRRALRQAQSAVTVTQIAADWGFFHFGRLAHDYYDMFGELPSQTLRMDKPSRYRPFSA
jgi:AraC family ethanolamine operon transcriptional activator